MATAFQLRRAAGIIRGGGIILYPTDTIYGLGCDPYDRLAVRRLYALKQRPPDKTLILAAGSMEQLDSCIDVPAGCDLAADTPTTWVVPAGDDCPGWLVADDGSIAVRVSRHPDIIALCGIIESPIVSTSANISGLPPVRDTAGIHRVFHGRVDMILVGDAQSTGRASTVRRLGNNTIIRA